MSAGGKHGHTIRRLRRRLDAVLEQDRESRRPAPPPISAEHAAMRERIERDLAALLDPEDPDSTDIADRVAQNPELAGPSVELLVLMREEREFLAARGVDYRPYDRYQPRFQSVVHE